MYMCTQLNNLHSNFTAHNSYVNPNYITHCLAPPRRQPGESKDEKRLRKQAVKDERRVCTSVLLTRSLSMSPAGDNTCFILWKRSLLSLRLGSAPGFDLDFTQGLTFPTRYSRSYILLGRDSTNLYHA